MRLLGTTKLLCLFLLAATLVQVAVAQKQKSTLGWDLTYSSILAKNKINRNAWLRKWLKLYHRSPAKQWVMNWNEGRIVSAVLIEHPAFHAGERSTLLFVRTKSSAFYWASVQEEWERPKRISERTQREEIKPALFDSFYDLASLWQQGRPLKIDENPKYAIPGYFGVLSLYSKGRARQILLSLKDFLVCETKDCKNDKPGRILDALSPIFNDIGAPH